MIINTTIITNNKSRATKVTIVNTTKRAIAVIYMPPIMFGTGIV
jgi:hypothetical protein